MDDQPIDDLPLGDPYKKKLHTAGITTISALREAIKSNTLLRRKLIGPDSARNIKNALTAFDRDQAPATQTSSHTIVINNQIKNDNTAISAPQTTAASTSIAEATAKVKQNVTGERSWKTWVIAGVTLLGVVATIAAGVYKEWFPWISPEKKPVVSKPVETPPAQPPVKPEAHEPTITFRGTRFNEKQKTSLDGLRIALKGPDEVFNAKGRDYEGKPIEDWIGRFESDGGKPKSPEEGREFTVVFDDNFIAVCHLKPGVVGDELKHLNPGDQITIARAWVRHVAKEQVGDESTGDLVVKTQGRFRLFNCELKMPL